MVSRIYAGTIARDIDVHQSMISRELNWNNTFTSFELGVWQDKSDYVH